MIIKFLILRVRRNATWRNIDRPTWLGVFWIICNPQSKGLYCVILWGLILTRNNNMRLCRHVTLITLVPVDWYWLRLDENGVNFRHALWTHIVRDKVSRTWQNHADWVHSSSGWMRITARTLIQSCFVITVCRYTNLN